VVNDDEEFEKAIRVDVEAEIVDRNLSHSSEE
jgi:hypothetical protein